MLYDVSRQLLTDLQKQLLIDFPNYASIPNFAGLDTVQ